jgi:hypothetical protein
MKIARSFNCGFEGIKSTSPEGATEFSAMVLSAAPPGLDFLDGFLPVVKTAGYFRLSLRDEISKGLLSQCRHCHRPGHEFAPVLPTVLEPAF